MSTQFVEGNGQPKAVLAVGQSDPEPANKRKSFQERVHDFEHEIIGQALEETGGRVTKAAKNLGLTHQGLCYIIQSPPQGSPQSENPNSNPSQVNYD